jgi:hypothetical protein
MDCRRTGRTGQIEIKIVSTEERLKPNERKATLTASLYPFPFHFPLVLYSRMVDTAASTRQRED